MFNRGFYNRRDMLWGEGGLAGAFCSPFHLLDLLDGKYWLDGCTASLEGLRLEFLGLGGEESILSVVCLHLEVGAKCRPAWNAGDLWQWVTFVGHQRICQVLLDVSHVLVVHLSRGRQTKRHNLLGR